MNKAEKLGHALEGFWYSKKEPHFPKPKSWRRPWRGRRQLLWAMRRVQRRINDTNAPWADYGKLIRYRGASTCRICSRDVGSTEYWFKGWVWPEGLLHYIEEHNVKPSKQFRHMVVRALGKEPK